MCALPTTLTPWTGPNNSWTSANSGDGAITSTTTGDTQPKPIRMPGSSVGAVPTAYTTAAKAVYPVYDGVTKIAGVIQSLAIDPQTGLVDFDRYPASFWKDATMTEVSSLPPDSIDPADFMNWHSAFQAEYIQRYSDARLDIPANYQIRDGSNLIAWYMLDDMNRPVNILSLTLSDYAKLTDAEKLRFNDNLESSGHFGELGLTTSQSEKQTAVTSLTTSKALITSSTMTAGQKGLFEAQIQMLIDEIGNPPVEGLPALNLDKITEAANKIMGRFKIVDTFVKAPKQATTTISGNLEMQTGPFYEYNPAEVSSSTLVKTKVNSLDGGKMQLEGVTAFLRAEAEILNMKQRRGAIVGNTTYRDPNLDVPNLIYQLQLLYEGESKGVVDAGTEEFRQLHKLLEHYNVMQQLLSTTISYFDGGKTDEKRRFMNIGVKDDGDIDEDQYEYTPRNTDLGYLRTYVEKYGSTEWINSDEHVPRYHWSVLADYDPDDLLAKMHRDFVADLDDDDNYSHKGDVEGKLDRTEMLAFSMFANEAWANVDNRWHPVEELYGAPRPEFDLIDESEEGAGSLQLYSKNTFDQFQTKLSNTITILNQQNQIKQNDVENATKEQNRHFELGNNALRKMNDLLLMIGRS